MSNYDKHIREFAYQIWESEGRPDGQQERHWEMAHKLAQAQALAPSKTAPRATKAKSPAKPVAEKKPRAPRKPASS